jgi:hypothetical protein
MPLRGASPPGGSRGPGLHDGGVGRPQRLDTRTVNCPQLRRVPYFFEGTGGTDCR